MKTKKNRADRMEIDEIVEAFEEALRTGLEIDLREFLPCLGNHVYAPVLLELIRVDMEYRGNSDHPTTLHNYRQAFPELFLDLEALQEVAFEEYRQRRERGEKPSPAEYELLYGVDTSSWPSSSSHAHSQSAKNLVRRPD